MIIRLVLILVVLVELASLTSSTSDFQSNGESEKSLYRTHGGVSCASANKSGPNPDVFWINMDKSLDRRRYFETQLESFGLLRGSSRIRGMTPDSVIIPEEIRSPQDCKMLESKSVTDVPELMRRPRGKILIDALCGRPRNNKHELTVTVSHLQALRTAVNSISESPYALILEDDMQFAFDVDYHALAASAPKDFAILQLVTSNDQNLKYLWKKYKDSDGEYLWEQRSDITDFWCAGAYIVNKEVFRPIINRISRKITSNGWIGMSIIAGYLYKPAYCSADVDRDYPNNPDSPNKRQTFFHGWDFDNRTMPFPRMRVNPACQLAPKGYQADHFIYEIARPHAYTLSVPLIGGMGKVGKNSTLHQEHVQWHAIAFEAINEMQTELKDGSVKLPSFAKMCPT
jgi:GR25 family glycosyltransferase involved in LPS biosynthesis